MKTLVVGLGSYQGADQIGWILIDELKAELNTQARFIKSKCDGSDWYHEIKDSQQVIFIDAMLSDEGDETIRELSAKDLKNIPAFSNKSTHSISLDDSIEMAKNLDILNVPVHIIGISITMAGLSGIDIGRAKKYIIDLVSRKPEIMTKNQR